MRKALLAAAIGGLSLLGLANSAKAESVLLDPANFSITPSGTGGIFNYAMDLVGTSTLRTNDFFVIFDFKGFTGNHSEPGAVGDWSFTTELVSGPITGTNGTLLVTDDPTIENLRWTRTGGNIVGAQALGVFSAESNSHAFTLGGLGARDFNSAPIINSPRVNSDTVPVPVPLPAAAWGGLALLGGLGAARLRKISK